MLSQLGTVVTLSARFIAAKRPVPSDLQELFLLFEQGYWPCGYHYTHGDDSWPQKLRVV